ncbi:SpoIIE family protein phosphatase [Streptacidiphilus fuscans]|uniref:SpoIIE family protein phosphatase n=1 Tax=Streptacidiphilus fuscans TaxID=2789292 RepID=A0A931FHN7_9ACTN|nr:SpoIIE family protein phosphatase [Streptacidiphilus fuscans]MBF9072021.1 SpoIIE family protein phosphatase [Streptacidiphilus fuscans]
MARDGRLRDGDGDVGEGPGTASAYLDLAAELARTEGRRLLDLATGVLVAQQGVEPAVAGEALRRLAVGAGLPLADLAADIVNAACGEDVVKPGEPGSHAHLLPEPRARRRVASAAEADADLDELAATVLGELHPLGVRGLLLWRRAAGDCLRLAGSAGFPPLVRAQWGQIPPQWRAKPQQALDDDTPLWLPVGVLDPHELPGPDRASARALLPLRHEGRSVGVVLVAWQGPRELDADLRRRVLGLVEVLARVLARGDQTTDPGGSLPVLASALDLLAEPAMTLRRGRRPGLFVEYLNAAAYRLSSGVPRPVGRPLSHVLPTTAEELAAMVADAHRNGAVQRVDRLPHVRRPNSAPMLNVRVLALSAQRCLVFWHTENRDHSFTVLKRAGRLGSLAAFEDDTARGVTQWSELVAPCLGLPAEAEPFPLEQLANLLVADDRPELARMLETLTARLDGVSGVLRIPRPDGGVRHVRLIAEPLVTHGTLTGLTGFFQDVSLQYQTEEALAATFDALGSAQAQAALRHRLALQLQQAIVPEQPDLRGFPGLEVVARYRPAAEEYRVGGDWYDMLGLPDGRVMIAVGDVAGHGIEAATGMVALRNALRGLAVSGGEPGELMHWLNEVTLRSSGHPTATAVCGHFDPEDRLLHWTSAGHLPALLLREGRARLLEAAPHLLLGAVADVHYGEAQIELRRGDLLLLFTDGLIERRHSSLDDALALLCRVVEQLAPDADLDAQADALLAAAVGDTDDDASLVLVRLN